MKNFLHVYKLISVAEYEGGYMNGAVRFSLYLPTLCCALLVSVLLLGCSTPPQGPGIDQLRPIKTGFAAQLEQLAARIRQGETVAVARIPEWNSGDFTDLGDLWRNRLENGLTAEKVHVKARGEIKDLMEESEAYGSNDLDENTYATDILVSASYRLDTSSQPPTLYLNAKALRRQNAEIVGAIEWQQPAEAGWERLTANVKGNVNTSALERARADEKLEKGPALSATLNKTPACYRRGEAVEIDLETDIGVYLYIFNIAADNSVSLLYPNHFVADLPLDRKHLLFPSAELQQHFSLTVSPLAGESFSKEAFKIVASREKLDFSFLPVPEDAIFAGVKGGDIRKVIKTLTETRSWSEVMLSYGVGSGCT